MSQPDSDYTKNLQLSWTDIHQDSQKLGHALKSLRTWEKVVAITRGGLVPAAIVSRVLGVRLIDTICMSSYEGMDGESGQAGEFQFFKTLEVTDGGESLLLIDDLVDKGGTAKILKEMYPKAHLGVLYAKPEGKPYADTSVRDVPQETWIYFPWELDADQAEG